ncbi:MAG: endolytic transglycosylase MltG [Alphaproteobacteria bacterium]
MRRFLWLGLIVAILAAGANVAVSRFNRYLAAGGPNAAETIVLLPRGAGLQAIVHRLDEAEVISRPWLFQLAVRLGGHDRALKAGEYAFPAHVSPSEVIAIITEGKTVARRLTVIEGQTVAEVFRSIDQAEGLSGELPEKPAEGTLLPETYLYSQGDTKAALVQRMQDAMAAALKTAWAGRAEDLPFATPEEALIMASIVDKETGVADERAKVAAVFVNRLRKGMRLQSDPTIIYGLTDGEGPLERELTRQDWKLDHPYNTYVIRGLTPGPIGNPGRESIEAVLNPDQHDYLYFVADGTGGHAFAETLKEHNDNVARWRRIKAGEEPIPRRPSPPRPLDLVPSSESAASEDRPKPEAGAGQRS